MSDDIIKVGNRVRRASWAASHPGIVISAVGRDSFLAINAEDFEGAWTSADRGWELVPEPPRRYVVEHRAPKRGERYWPRESVLAGGDHESYSVHYVIVEEL